jgi:phosphohistidine phosphatase
MFLYVLRHAWAGEFGDPQWPDDSLRPLSREGARRFARVAELLIERGVAPAVIATSPYVRCRQTAEILADLLEHRPRIVELPALAPGSDLASLVAWSQSHAGQDICWVGHKPDVSNLTAALLGSPELDVRFAKATMAALEFAGTIAPGRGRLYWLATAKMLGV